jgi:hypothetical protein
MGSRYVHKLVPFHANALRMMKLAHETGEPISIKIDHSQPPMPMWLTHKHAEKLEGGRARSIKFTHAHLRHLHGKGIFQDIGSALGSAAGEAVNAIAPGAGLVAGPAASMALGMAGKAIDDAIAKGKFDAKQAAVNFNKARQIAIDFTNKSIADQDAYYAQQLRIPYVGNIIAKKWPTEADYAAAQEHLASQPAATEDSMRAAYNQQHGSGRKRYHGGRMMSPHTAALLSTKGGAKKYVPLKLQGVHGSGTQGYGVKRGGARTCGGMCTRGGCANCGGGIIGYGTSGYGKKKHSVHKPRAHKQHGGALSLGELANQYIRAELNQ